MKNVKASNNLRDMYIRGITLGGQDEVIYEETELRNKYISQILAGIEQYTDVFFKA